MATKFSKLFFAALKTEKKKLEVCAHYNTNNKPKNLGYSTLCRWINTSDEKITMVSVLKSIQDVTGLEDNQIYEPTKKAKK